MKEIIARLQVLYDDAIALRPAYSSGVGYDIIAKGYVSYAEALTKLCEAKYALGQAKNLLGVKED